MPPLANVLAFVVASAALIAIPGPSVLFVIGRSLALGRRGGLISVLGNTLGMLPLVALVAVGVGAIVAQSIVVFTVIKLLGAAYLVYLGVQTIRHRRVGPVVAASDAGVAESADGTAPVTSARAAAPKRARRLLAEAFVVGVTNPKTIVFFVAALPQFVDLDAGAVPLQMLVLGAVFAALALCMDSTWAIAAGTARGWFARSPRRIEHLRAGGGVMMVGLGGVLALSGSKS